MRFTYIKNFSFNLRSAVFGFTAAGLFFVCSSTMNWAQRAGGDAPSRFMERIDQEEGLKRMAAFRGQRLDGDYCFRFELEHLPRRGNKVTYSGTMWGSWNEKGPITRFKLFSKDTLSGAEIKSDTVELIVQNGACAQAWIRKDGSSEFELIQGEALFTPIIPGVVYTPFDLQMPFIYWADFIYEGPGRVQSRIAQQFLMYPPAASQAVAPEIGAVRIGLDDAYDALLRVEVLDAAGDELSRFTVESFKKVQEQYIVKEITLKDYGTRDRTRFQVKAASVGLIFNPLFFCADQTVEPPFISDAMFEVL